jgi:hypothetical protein
MPAQPGGTAIAIGIADAKIRAPYDVQVIRENGDTLPTYASKDRFYVQGNAGERYIIRVSNPTARRVEAVVTVDGLDVIDGEDGDLRKRGYVVPPYGEVRIEGFRTSTADVATFRFNSVNDSYANKKGKARNVGVIAVALFEEQHAPEQQIIVGDATKDGEVRYKKPYSYEDDLDEGGESVSTGRTYDRAPPPPPAKTAKRAPAAEPKPDAVSTRGGENARRVAPTTVAPRPMGGAGGAPARPQRFEESEDVYEPPPAEAPRNNRPGLGTEFGESRYSAASYTKFVRAAGAPIAVAELRYNNAAGLAALGINAEPLPDHGEIMTRETADPFPGDPRFSRPPVR